MFVLNCLPPPPARDLWTQLKTIVRNLSDTNYPGIRDGDYNVTRKGLDSSWKETSQHKTKLQKLVMTF